MERKSLYRDKKHEKVLTPTFRVKPAIFKLNHLILTSCINSAKTMKKTKDYTSVNVNKLY